jgi:hypothetical protein
MRALMIIAALMSVGGLSNAVSAGATSAAAAPSPLPPIASLTDGVWMKGDLHIHSRHSTDSSNNPIAKIIALAETVHMDYLCITDHDNHVNGDIAHNTWTDPEFKSKSVLLLYCAEWTTNRGHATTISAKPYDHQAFYDVRDQRDVVIAAEKKRLGIHLSANHPANFTNAFSFSYDMVDSVEIWNSAIWSTNAGAIKIWDGLLKSGRRLTGRGGSDSHHGYPDTPAQATPLSREAPANNVGTPTTWVFATARNRQAVVEALTNGRVSISANPYSPRVELFAARNPDGPMDMMMGDNAASTGRPVTFRVQLSGKTVPGGAYTVKVVKNGGPFRVLPMSGDKPVVEFQDTPETGVRSYYRVEVEGPQIPYPEIPQSAALSGKMVALSNPIYFNFDPKF